jgi:hypothetical protein
MGKMQRTKGAEWERTVVNTAKAFGLEARRTAPNQTQDGSDSFGDVTINGLKCECKHHADIPQWIEMVNCALLKTSFQPKKIVASWIAGHDALVIKQTRSCAPLVLIHLAFNGLEVITMEEFFRRLKDAPKL